MKKKMQDDLTTVKGIGPARQKWLGELFDVYSFEALSGLSAEEVEATAKKAGKILAKGDVADWIAQGKVLAAEKSSGSGVKAGSDVAATLSSWKPIASFVVEFQQKDEGDQLQRRTTVHHMEADEEISWPGIEREQLGLWLEQHVQVSNLPPKTKSTAAVAKSPTKKVEVMRPTQVRLFQEPDYLSTLSLDASERPFLGHIYHEEAVTLEVDFEMEDSAAAQTQRRQTRYDAQCELHNLTANQKPSYLEMQRDVLPNCLTYRTDLSALEPGIYRLAVVLRGERPLDSAYFELPKLNIL